MLVENAHRKSRRGATAVETALVLLPLVMFLFGIFEYGRLLMDLNLLDNAAREGCRFALANNTDTTINSEVDSIVKTYMAGRDASFAGFTSTVTGTHNGVSTPVNDLMPGDPIIVTVSGKYSLLNIIPLVSNMTSFTVSSSVAMICEGGT